ncbi:response regulator transcription factor [Actinoplanes siamensis]|uniref:response regulator transcription factor n=1 Tax=Actinoplanes siamensis TaxID=1223317 RepID=UPI0019405883|nr:LuxR C-terminal-related transcriptional regulator [Actinoplanes siamensis]
MVLPDGADADPLGLIAAGARAVIADEAELGAARAAVLAGGSYLSPAVLARLAPSEPVETVRLAPREVAALHCIVAGLTHREAARELGVTEQSFNTYAKRLRRKLGATNKAELTRRAAELGYVPM